MLFNHANKVLKTIYTKRNNVLINKNQTSLLLRRHLSYSSSYNSYSRGGMTERWPLTKTNTILNGGAWFHFVWCLHECGHTPNMIRCLNKECRKQGYKQNAKHKMKQILGQTKNKNE